jgi:hypothetical protein
MLGVAMVVVRVGSSLDHDSSAMAGSSGIRVDDWLAGMRVEDRLGGRRVEDRLAGRRVDDRLAGMRVEDRLGGMRVDNWITLAGWRGNIWIDLADRRVGVIHGKVRLKTKTNIVAGNPC